MNVWWSILVVSAAVRVASGAEAGRKLPLGNPATQRETAAWRVGDCWKVIVEAYAGIPELAIADPTKRPRVPHVFAKYSMLIRVVGSIPYSNSVCWVVDFLPDGSAPEAIKEQRYRVLVSQDGFMRKVELRSAATDPVAFETFGGMMFLRHMLPGFPIQMLPPHPNNGTVLERSGRRRHLIFGNTSKGQERLVEGRLETVGRDGGHEVIAL